MALASACRSEPLHAAEIVRARSYALDPGEAHLLAIVRDGRSELLSAEALSEPLARAAIRYLRAAGKTELHWLDPANEEYGYSAVP